MEVSRPEDSHSMAAMRKLAMTGPPITREDRLGRATLANRLSMPPIYTIFWCPEKQTTPLAIAPPGKVYLMLPPPAHCPRHSTNHLKEKRVTSQVYFRIVAFQRGGGMFTVGKLTNLGDLEICHCWYRKITGFATTVS